ncbi:unnamed protein product [Schistocephalus solidus]|uniref:Protein sidekick-2 n=1 Tax=Schistocephalus solidus TaxID=70667 RepID=A0A183TBP3_SCHSO|nr:unnamed protein product [Schistocephalus solidus]
MAKDCLWSLCGRPFAYPCDLCALQGSRYGCEGRMRVSPALYMALSIQWDPSEVWWYIQEWLWPCQQPVPSPISGLLDSVLTTGSALIMPFVENTRNRVHSFAKTHHLCCNIIGVFFLILGLGFLIWGSILVHNYKNAFSQELTNTTWPSYPNYDDFYYYYDYDREKKNDQDNDNADWESSSGPVGPPQHPQAVYVARPQYPPQQTYQAQPPYPHAGKSAMDHASMPPSYDEVIGPANASAVPYMPVQAAPSAPASEEFEKSAFQ